MAQFGLKLPDELARKFDAWAKMHGGRGPALRTVMARACETSFPTLNSIALTGSRTVQVNTRITRTEYNRLGIEAQKVGLSRSGWMVALARRRLTGRPTFLAQDEVALIAIQSQIDRISFNVVQISKVLKASALVGEPLTLELAYLEELSGELKTHMKALRRAFVGNLSYWSVDE